ncbi:hypothetical protein [Streptomyces sp. NBC_01483]|uniref:hypothetical protein n=1 Tax=Streptomyces sp. NBC_01483 TaxID=2903883 RepID=UPI002E31274B|nr:hypothetical protein [Streptomyces sp. NBC_01483]
MGGDLVVDLPAAAGCSGVDGDRLPAQQQIGIDGVPTKHWDGSILNVDLMSAEPWEGRAACASVPGPPDVVS